MWAVPVPSLQWSHNALRGPGHGGLSHNATPTFCVSVHRPRTPAVRAASAALSGRPASPSDGPVLVTVLGKGGSGKTTAAVLLALYYAAAGKRTCLLLQSLDRYAEELLGCAVSASAMTPIAVTGSSAEGEGASNLCAIRLDTTKFLLEPLEVAKEVDQRLGLTQGALSEVVGEELSVLPGMDAFTAIAAIELLAKPGGGLLRALERRRGATTPKAKGKGKSGGGGVLGAYPWGSADADVVIYDGASSSEVLRLLGSPERGRWYLRRFRAVAESTDAGRVALPTVARALESELGLSGQGGQTARSSADVWAKLDDVISGAVDTIANPRRVKVLLVAPSADKSALRAARRLWGCTLQAGARVSGVLHHGALPAASQAALEELFPSLPLLPLPSATAPQECPPSSASSGHRGAVWGEEWSSSAEGVLLKVPEREPRAPVSIDVASSKVAVFLPGFDKSEIKLQQWKGGSQLLVDAGDQRRCIDLPQQMWGKIAGAKFVDGRLEIRTTK